MCVRGQRLGAHSQPAYYNVRDMIQFSIFEQRVNADILALSGLDDQNRTIKNHTAGAKQA